MDFISIRVLRFLKTPTNGKTTIHKVKHYRKNQVQGTKETREHMRTHVCGCVYGCLCLQLHACVYVCMYVCMYVYTYVQNKITCN